MVQFICYNFNEHGNISKPKTVKFKKQTNRLYTAHETLITSKACSLFSLLHPSNSVLKH